MLTWVIVGGVLLTAGVVVWRLGAQPYRHRNIRPDDLVRFFTVLLERGEPGGTLSLELAGSGRDQRFVQFAKYEEGEEQGIQFAFPKAPWSQDVYHAVERDVTAAGFQPIRRVADNGDVREFLIVDLGKDTKAATRLGTVVVNTVFGLKGNEPRLDLHFKGVRPS